MKNGMARQETLKSELVSLLPRLRRFARSLTRDPEMADDLVQEACERALGRLGQVQEGTRFDSWLYRIVHTRWIDRMRKGKTQSAHLAVVSNKIGSEAVGADSVIQFDRALDIKRALKTLPEEHLAAIMLVCVEGYSYAEAAEIVGVPTGTIASRVARARTVLSRYLFHKQQHGRRSSVISKKR